MGKTESETFSNTNVKSFNVMSHDPMSTNIKPHIAKTEANHLQQKKKQMQRKDTHYLLKAYSNSRLKNKLSSQSDADCRHLIGLSISMG